MATERENAKIEVKIDFKGSPKMLDRALQKVSGNKEESAWRKEVNQGQSKIL